MVKFLAVESGANGCTRFKICVGGKEVVLAEFLVEVHSTHAAGYKHSAAHHIVPQAFSGRHVAGVVVFDGSGHHAGHQQCGANGMAFDGALFKHGD